MTFDDGILTIYQKVNVSEKGLKPKYSLHQKSRYYYRADTIGYRRYYEALKANQQFDKVVSIYCDREVQIYDIVVLDDDPKQYMVTLVQQFTDDDGIYCTRLTLGESNEQYSIQA